MSKTIIIAAGGTGGHIFPGVAIAEELANKDYKIVWLGTKAGLEATLIPKYNIDLYFIKISGFRGKGWFLKLLALFNIVIALFQSLIILFKVNPCLVLGMGGFVTGPVGIAAWLLRKKLIIHEQNAIAGTTNRILLNFANHVLESFPHSFKFNNNNLKSNNRFNDKLILTGNPVRKNLLDVRLKKKINHCKKEKFQILVLGGSRGARFLNQIVPEALGDIDNIKIIHQTGIKEFDSTYNLYVKKNIHNNHEIKPFIDDMAQAYSQVDLLICRSGGSTIFEIMAVGLASILIPLPWSIDDHQKKNALYLEEKNAAIVINQKDLNIEQLKVLVQRLIEDPNKLQLLSYNARSLYEQYENNNVINSILAKI
jgi:UDP-N-acetylglucosamine--N-acetylmuramyl-(pentapeptide) pyrophosphoryl-undecaprenol N-acetylglucosamine transferase